MGRITSAAIGVGVLVAGLFAATAAKAQAGTGCAALTGKALGAHGTVLSAKDVAADPAKRLPAYCEVSAVLTPASGSRIGTVFRLPESWNGKILGLGGGGWAGNVTLAAAATGLQRGYATAQTDGGHPGTDLWNTDWATNPAAAADFSYRAIHETALAARQVVALRYGKPQTHAYYQGCSTGGRMGMMEAQRFPTDYDGIIAGAPVYTLQVQTSAMLRNQAFGAPGAALSVADLALVNAAVLTACDAADGQRDGIVADPRACRWDPRALACKPGQQAGQCLAPPQVAALRVAYDGVRAKDGSWAAFPLARGGETGWARFINAGGAGDVTRGGGMIGLKPLLFGEAQVDMGHLTPADAAAARQSAFARDYEAGSPDIRAFAARGGKLILWHGWSDPGPSPTGTIDYYEAVRKAAPDTAGNVRLFLAPGVEHCGGGPGADQPDTLTALEAWVERGQAPATVVATRADGPMTRPLCPFPTRARYDGRGGVDDPRSYRCAP